jgi:hypothetical protein
MPRSKTRGTRKEHNKRVEKRNIKLKADEIAVEKLRKIIFEEAKQRYLDKQSGDTENTFTINLDGK